MQVKPYRALHRGAPVNLQESGKAQHDVDRKDRQQDDNAYPVAIARAQALIEFIAAPYPQKAQHHEGERRIDCPPGIISARIA
jgi:hypothetical protein